MELMPNGSHTRANHCRCLTQWRMQTSFWKVFGFGKPNAFQDSCTSLFHIVSCGQIRIGNVKKLTQNPELREMSYVICHRRNLGCEMI